MSQYMLLFSLGPVQTFIAQARKTRDLWVGSLLLSKLMEVAMDGVKGEFIFPATRKVEDTPDIPNKYVAIFDDLSQAQEAAAQSKRQIAERWRRICDAVWKEIIADHGDEETRRIWKRQTGVDPETHQTDLDTFFETYWVIVERKEGQEYGDWFEETESTLAARKRLRDFKAEEEPGEKSAISGEREILRRSEVSPRKIQEFWLKVAAHHSQMDIDQEGKEHLDAIDTIKRFAMEVKAITTEKPFPSTSSIATASFVERLIEAAIDPPRVLDDWHRVTGGKLVSKAREATQDIPFLAQKSNDPKYSERSWLLRRDGDLYFPETFVPRRLEEDYRVTNISDAESLARNGKEALRALLKATDTLNITRPTPYYAVVQMDGDNMGILLSGVQDDAEHSRISKALSSFSRETALDLVEKLYPARLVYAGGDDVLAFAPLARDIAEAGQPRHVLDLVDMLQGKYRERVIDALPKPKNEERVKGITASAGVVIAHHYTSLSYVLRSAREAESIAKKRYGRNALVVTLIRRSGEHTRVGSHWRYDKLADDGQPMRLFSRFYTLFKQDILSPKCVYVLLEEASTLIGLTEDAQASEIKRVLLRQYDRVKDNQNKHKEEIPVLAKHLAKLARAMDDDMSARYTPDKKPEMAVELHADKTRYGIVETLGWLLVIAFLARKEQE